MGDELKDVGTDLVVTKSLFYDLCARANSVCNINYDKINLMDLFGFVSIAQRQTYRDIKIHKHLASKAKQKEMSNKIMSRRNFK